MLNKEELLRFLLKARTKTYAGAGGKVQPAFGGSNQLEYREGDWVYRDVYYTGNRIFMGLEAIYNRDQAVWSMSYYGSFKEMTEEELDKILREALMENWENTRIWKKVEWEKDGYKYICQPDFEGSIDKLAGLETISKEGKEIYKFLYAGGILK